MDSTRQVIGISGLICFGTEIKPLVLILFSNLPLSQDACSGFCSACHDSHWKEKMSALTQIPLVQLTQVSILNQSVSLGGIWWGSWLQLESHGGASLKEDGTIQTQGLRGQRESSPREIKMWSLTDKQTQPGSRKSKHQPQAQTNSHSFSNAILGEYFLQMARQYMF